LTSCLLNDEGRTCFPVVRPLFEIGVARTAVILHNSKQRDQYAFSQLNQEVMPAMDVIFNVILPRLVCLSLVFLAILWLWALYAFIQARRAGKVIFRLPIRQSSTFLLVVMGCVIIAASLLAGGGHLLGRLFSNPGHEFTLVGALIGSVTGMTIGWGLQSRSTL
jgi:hypothetical protein